MSVSLLEKSASEHNLLPDCVFDGRLFIMYVVKILCQASLPSFSTRVSLAIFCL